MRHLNVSFSINTLWKNNLGQIFDLKSSRLYSKHEIIQETSYLQERLQGEFGIKTGDRVILKNGNNALFFFQLFALWSLGAAAIPVSRQAAASELKFIIAETNARLLIDENAIIKLPMPGSPEQIATASEALILFTSGTTAHPKGVVFDISTIYKKIESLANYIAKKDIAKTLCALPTHFGHGLIGNCLFPLLNGAELFIMPPLDLVFARSFSKLVESHKITFFSSVPAFWPLLLTSDSITESALLERVHCASAPLSLERAKEVKSWVGKSRLYDVYGMTETLSWVGAKEITQNSQESGIREYWGAECALEESADLPNNKEIFVKTKQMFSYYLNDDGLTRASKISDEKFKTGDLGKLNSQNEITLCGRTGNIINKGGYKISPEAIDAALIKISFIKQACTFGYDDPIWGKKVGVAIVLRSSGDQSAELEQKIMSLLALELSANLLPDKIWFTQKIEHNSAGKINRQSVRKKIMATV